MRRPCAPTAARLGLRLAQDNVDDSKVAERAGNKAAQKRLRRLQEAALRPAADFELWYAAGVRFDLLPVTTYAYRLRGTTLGVQTPGTNYRVDVCGTVRFPYDPFLYTYRPRKNPKAEPAVGKPLQPPPATPECSPSPSRPGLEAPSCPSAALPRHPEPGSCSRDPPTEP